MVTERNRRGVQAVPSSGGARRMVAWLFVFLAVIPLMVAVPAHAACGRLCDADFMASATVKVVQDALKGGARVNARNRYGWTPLHLVARRNEAPDVAVLLLQHGADVNAQDNNDWTPLHYAAAFNPNPAIAEMLFEAGAWLNARERNGHTPRGLAEGLNRNPAVAGMLRAVGGRR